MIMNKDLNEMLRSQGEQPYYTPMAVVGELVSPAPARLVLIDPPMIANKKREHHFKKMLRIGKLRFYITWNFRLKNSQTRDQNRDHNGILLAKREKWEATNGVCECCGKKLDKFNRSQIHHVLSWWRVPQFECDQRNLLLLCPECHNKIHKDPFIQTRMIEEKCKELGVNVSDYYDKPSEP